MFEIKDEPIINSLLDEDFYKFSMGQLIFEKHCHVPVRFKFSNRTKGISLPKIIPIEQLREQLDHVRTLRFNNSELHYLRGTNEYQERMFRENYLQHLQHLRLPEYDLEYIGDEINLEFPGDWGSTTYWETLAISVINELNYRNQLKKMSQLERDNVFATGVTRLLEKIKKLRQYPDLTFSDFGTRRRFMRIWQKYVVAMLAYELPKQFKGTSNVKLAMDDGYDPTGTNAHEMDMAYSGIYHGSDEEIRGSHRRFLTDWREMYGWGLSVLLSDTYGSDFFFSDMTKDDAELNKGLRQDSGNPIVLGEKAIKVYQGYGVDPISKLIVFSDGLEVEKMIKIHLHFLNRIMNTFGWGTDETNDLGLRPLSLVIKLVEANGHGTVKLSDNLNKAIGRPEDVTRFKRIFGYTNEAAEDCKY